MSTAVLFGLDTAKPGSDCTVLVEVWGVDPAAVLVSYLEDDARIQEMRDLSDQLVLMDPSAPGLTDEQRNYRLSETAIIRAKQARIWKGE